MLSCASYTHQLIPTSLVLRCVRYEAHLASRAGEQPSATDPKRFLLASRSTCTPASIAWLSSWMGRALGTSFRGPCQGAVLYESEHPSQSQHARDSRSVLRLSELHCEAALCARQPKERRRTEIKCTHISRDEFCVFLACNCILEICPGSSPQAPTVLTTYPDNQPDKKPATRADNFYTYIPIPCDCHCSETWFSG